jgi:hypothetical protein
MSAETVNSAKVRMYRHGFGDCFLLSFFHNNSRVFSMVVDCGIKLNTRSADVPIREVIGDLQKTLKPAADGKPVIDVLVATHEHWDHVAYFHPTKSPDFFSAFDIRQTWLAWTENPDDEEAVTINSRLREGAAALQVAAERLHAVETEESDQFHGFQFGSSVAAARKRFNEELSDVLGFYGVAAGKERKTSQSGIKYKTQGTISVETEAAMSHIIALGKAGGINYLEPGTTVDRRVLPPGVSVYVLGPPRNSLINRSKPSSGSAQETYLGIDRSGLTGFIDRVLQFEASPRTTTSATNADGPFGKGSGLTVKQAEVNPYFRQTYFAAHESYRRIDNAWLDAAGPFALQLDAAINNTSLVLAIELEESGKVLLFPGDAQVGSWLSWHDLRWNVKRGDKTETITTPDLLKNTVLYKVSHHGSHNASVREQGLELMTHPDLVAMIPEKEKSYNGILYQPLMRRLQELCKGRVLVSADINFPPEDLVEKRPAELSAAEWESFKGALKVCRLYVEYTIR